VLSAGQRLDCVHSHAAINVWTCTKPKDEIATPFGFAKSGTRFTIKWLRYGHADPCNRK
jgi:hypothetical protein